MDECDAGEGMQADGEKRRSTRVRHRPLEWWRMETKVYKRAHNSALFCLIPVPATRVAQTSPQLGLGTAC